MVATAKSRLHVACGVVPSADLISAAVRELMALAEG